MEILRQLRDRFWLLVMTLLWASLSVTTYASDDPVLQFPLWWLGSYVISLLCGYFVLVRNPRPYVAMFVSYAIVVYCLARGIRMGLDGDLVRMVLWFLCANLTIHAHRIGRILILNGVPVNFLQSPSTKEIRHDQGPPKM